MPISTAFVEQNVSISNEKQTNYGFNNLVYLESEFKK